MELLANIIKKVETDGISKDLSPMLMELRPHYIEKDKDPLVTRLLRMTANHIDATGTFHIRQLEVEEEEASPDPKAELAYFLQLCQKPNHPANREELTEIKLQFLERGEK